MIGFDLDGTITEDWATRFEWTAEDMKKCNHDEEYLIKLKMLIMNAQPIMKPIIYPHIITSRPVCLYRETYDWLGFHRIKCAQIYMFEPDSFVTKIKERIKGKASIINELNLIKYFEDEEEIRKGLQQLCPDTEILTPQDAIKMGLAKNVPLQKI